jgi:hypothetical protein
LINSLVARFAVAPVTSADCWRIFERKALDMRAPCWIAAAAVGCEIAPVRICNQLDPPSIKFETNPYYFIIIV